MLNTRNIYATNPGNMTIKGAQIRNVVISLPAFPYILLLLISFALPSFDFQIVLSHVNKHVDASDEQAEQYLQFIVLHIPELHDCPVVHIIGDVIVVAFPSALYLAFVE